MRERKQKAKGKKIWKLKKRTNQTMKRERLKSSSTMPSFAHITERTISSLIGDDDFDEDADEDESESSIDELQTDHTDLCPSANRAASSLHFEHARG
jgi:hypothetical protein